MFGALLAVLVLSLAGCGANATAPSPVPSPQPSNAATPGLNATASPVPTDAASPSPSADAAGVLLTVATRGGRCANGPCGTTIVIDRDGRIHYAAKPPNEVGTLSPELLTELTDVIATTDFAELFTHQFNGQCPTDYDGQEIVFEFATADGVQRIASCEVEVDYESVLFGTVREAIGAFMPLPVE